MVTLPDTPLLLADRSDAPTAGTSRLPSEELQSGVLRCMPSKIGFQAEIRSRSPSRQLVVRALRDSNSSYYKAAP